jgi:hypothetical protein
MVSVSQGSDPDEARPGKRSVVTLKALPIACALGPGELNDRLERIASLTRTSLVSYQRGPRMLELLYARDASEQVRAMVDDESHCCPFLNFERREEPAAIRVVITAPDSARDAADELFNQFIPGRAESGQ